MSRSGPLNGLKVVEFVGLGPAPFACMMLADHGADVLRIDRPGAGGSLGLPMALDLPARNRPSIALDLKQADQLAQARALVDAADVLIEGFRPGVLERLGFEPASCLQRNPSLVIGRMTGWGQSGPLAQRAGHDLNYLSLTGSLAALGAAEGPPPPPLNLVADYGGGAMMLAFGVLAAVLQARSTGRGQVVDAAMVDGSALLATLFHGLRAGGQWTPLRSANLLDGGFPFYRCYRCADGRFVAVAPLEPAFRRDLLQGLGLADDPSFSEAAVANRALWPDQATRLERLFATRSRDAWAADFEHRDACLTPVLDWDEAAGHPHLAARGVFARSDGVEQAQPAPRFSAWPDVQALAPLPPAEPASTPSAIEAVVSQWRRL